MHSVPHVPYTFCAKIKVYFSDIGRSSIAGDGDHHVVLIKWTTVITIWKKACLFQNGLEDQLIAGATLADSVMECAFHPTTATYSSSSRWIEWYRPRWSSGAIRMRCDQQQNNIAAVAAAYNRIVSNWTCFGGGGGGGRRTSQMKMSSSSVLMSRLLVTHSTQWKGCALYPPLSLSLLFGT